LNTPELFVVWIRVFDAFIVASPSRSQILQSFVSLVEFSPIESIVMVQLLLQTLTRAAILKGNPEILKLQTCFAYCDCQLNFNTH